MADWTGLLNWSTKYHDGTGATKDFQAMSGEDKKWLEEAMNAHTFDDADRLREICEELKKDVDGKFQKDEDGTFAKILNLLEECQELIEIHERNCLNLSLLGGLEAILQYMLHHPDTEARMVACQTYNQVVQNNPQVQKVAHKLGSFNIMNKFAEETSIKSREAAFGALSSFIRGLNFDIKKEFLESKNGVQFLALILQDQAISLRLQKKVLFLINDLVQAEDKTAINQFLEQDGFLNKLFEILMLAANNLGDGQYWDIRENALMIVTQLFTVKPEARTPYSAILTNHKLKISKEI